MISWRLLYREMRGGNLTLLAISLVVSVATMTTTSVLTDRIDRAMREDAALLLGGDLKISGPRALGDDFFLKARELNLQSTEILEFPSVVGFGFKFELAGLKVISHGYPLRGTLKISDSRSGVGYATDRIPSPGTAWVDPQLASNLGLSIGDSVSVGETELAIAQILVFEPDRGGSFVSLSPRLLMNRADLENTELIQPGSRISHITLFAGSAAVAFKEWAEPKLDLSQRITDVLTGRSEIGNALVRATTYLSLAGLLTVLLAGAAIAMTAHRWASDQISTSALFRTLGLTGKATFIIFGIQLAVLGLIASCFGVVLGYILQIVLVDTISTVLDISLPAPGLYPAALGIFTGFCTLFGFGAPAIALLANVSPSRVFKRDFLVKGMRKWIRYMFSTVAITLIGLAYSEDIFLTSLIVVTVVVLFLFVTILGRNTIKLLKPMQLFGPAWRFGIQRLVRDPSTSGGQLMAFTMTILAIAMVSLIRFDLIKTWEAQVPDDAPNTFALNIIDTDVESFELAIRDLGGKNAPLYPIVRGRLDAVNEISILEHLSGKSPPRAVMRELSLTEARQLGRDNVIDRGRWFTGSDTTGLVTVESKLFDELNLRIGDKLTYVVGPDKISAKIIGTRSVQWESMLPNFFMIFSPGTLGAFESTRLTSINLPNPESDTAKISDAFRQVTLISIDVILEQVRGILDRITEAVGTVLYFVLGSGFLVLIASIQISLPERRREAAILRSFGGSDKLLSEAQWAEFLSLGLLSGLLAAVGTEILGRLVYTQIFEIEWPFFWWIWLVLPCVSACSIGLVGRWSARHARILPPASLLKIAEN